MALTKLVNGVAVQMTPEEEAAFEASRVIPVNRAALAARIDAAVRAVYDEPIAFSKEYEQREAQAKAYKDAGYTGAVPPRVAGFATPAGMTAKDAADLILSQAAQLRGALDELSDLRMKKYLVTKKDATGAFVSTDAEAQAVFDETMTAIKVVAAEIA